MIDEGDQTYEKIVIPDLSQSFQQYPQLKELYELCTSMINAIRESYQSKQTSSLKESFTRAQEYIIKIFRIITVFGFSKGLSVERAKNNGSLLFDVFLRIVGDLVERLSQEVIEFNVSTEEVYIPIIKFFNVLDKKSYMFKSCVYILNIVFLRLSRYLDEYSLDTITVNAYRVYRVNRNILCQDHFIEREMEDSKVMMNKIIQPLIKSRKVYDLPQIKLKNFLTDISILDCKNITLERLDTGELRIKTLQANNSPYFRELFEDLYVQQVCDFYQLEQTRISTLPTLDYIDKSTQIFQFEKVFCDSLHPQVYHRIHDEMKFIFVGSYYPIMWASQDVLLSLFESENFDQIEKVHRFALMDPDIDFYRSQLPKDRDDWIPAQKKKYNEKERLIDRPKCESTILIQLRAYVETQGKLLSNFDSLPKDPKTREQIPFQYVDSVLKLRDKIDNIIEAYLHDSPGAWHQKEYGFQLFLGKVPEAITYISVYLDRCMKTKDQSDQQFNINVLNICELVGYLLDKDTFLKEVQKKMYSRLLYGDAVIENERFLIRELVKRFTQDSTLTKCDNMIQDILKQDEYNKKFQNPEPTVAFSGKVLTQDQWPFEIPEQCILFSHHPILNNMLTSFETHFMTHISEERLVQWVPTEGRAEVYYQSPTSKEKKILLLTPAQMIAFMCYNYQDSFSVSHLINKLGVHITSLENLLIPLIANKVLTRQRGDLDQFDRDEVITLASTFNHKMKRIIMLPHKKFQPKRVESAETMKEREEQENERNKRIELAIVRLMKSKKTMTHQALVQEVTRNITLFRPTSTKIKLRIDDLMIREYLKRSEERIDVYEYLA